MAIKKVVLEKPKKIINKFPEFNKKKIYIRDLWRDNTVLLRFYKTHNSIQARYLNNNELNYEYASFEDYLRLNKADTVYVLDNQQDLARFLMGDREFPIVKQEESDTRDERIVSVDECVPNNKCYALQRPYDLDIYVFNVAANGDAKFNSLRYNGFWLNSYEGVNTTEAFKMVLKQGYEVYQFDTQEEFLHWSLERVTKNI